MGGGRATHGRFDGRGRRRAIVCWDRWTGRGRNDWRYRIDLGRGMGVGSRSHNWCSGGCVVVSGMMRTKTNPNASTCMARAATSSHDRARLKPDTMQSSIRRVATIIKVIDRHTAQSQSQNSKIHDDHTCKYTVIHSAKGNVYTSLPCI